MISSGGAFLLVSFLSPAEIWGGTKTKKEQSLADKTQDTKTPLAWWMSSDLETHDRMQGPWGCEEGRFLLCCRAIPVKSPLVRLWQRCRERVMSWVPKARGGHASPCSVGCEQSPDHPRPSHSPLPLHRAAAQPRWVDQDNFCKLLGLPLKKTGYPS